MSSTASHAPARRLPPTLVTSLAVVSVVGVFVGMTIVAQRYASAIDSMARSLATDAAPSIERLSTARGALRRLTLATRDALRAADLGEAPRTGAIAAAQKALDAAIADYLAVPPYPGERQLQRSAIVQIDDYKRALALVLDRIDRGALTQAHELVTIRFMPSSDAADAAIEKLEWLDADYASRTGASIKQTRRRASRLAYALAGLGAVVALVVMGLAWWAHRSFAAMARARTRLDSIRKRLAERRADELEVFAARVAHDLRNPLASIALRVALAERDAADPVKVRACLARVTTVVGNASHIIDGLLDFARAGGTPESDAHADAAAVVRSVVDDLAQEIETAGITLFAHIPAVAEVRCSAGALLSVVGNLLRNAVKYMADTTARDRVIKVSVLDGASAVRVEIEDTGPGIPPESAERIFEPYFRAAPRGRPGIGLGLATVKRIIEAHGGSVGVRAGANAGSCFWFELPKPTTLERSRPPSTDRAHA